MAAAAAANIVRNNTSKVLDWGTIETAAKGSLVLAKRSPAGYGLARRVLAVSARVVRRIFNYAPASKAPYQLRLSWQVGETVNLGWLPVTEAVYEHAAVGSYFAETLKS